MGIFNQNFATAVRHEFNNLVTSSGLGQYINRGVDLMVGVDAGFLVMLIHDDAQNEAKISPAPGVTSGP